MRSRNNTIVGANSSVFDNDEFKRIVGISLGKGSILMRKDRRGIAIVKGSKNHKITFRDKVPAEIAKAKEHATLVININSHSKVNPRTTEKMKPISVPDGMSIDSPSFGVVLKDNFASAIAE